jgi:heme-degrading monooxygenase HmoA
MSESSAPPQPENFPYAMTTEIIRYHIDASRAPEFEEAYRHAEPILQGSPHCLGYRLLRGHEEPENWILVIEWDSVEGHEQGFRKGASFRVFFEIVGPFIPRIQEMKHYETGPIRWQRTVI